jgi:hypothetical protein
MNRLLPKKKTKKPPKRLPGQSTTDFQHALHEYHQTVQPTHTLSNDDGQLHAHYYEVDTEKAQDAIMSSPPRRMAPIQESTLSGTTTSSVSSSRGGSAQQQQQHYLYPPVLSMTTSEDTDDQSSLYHPMSDNNTTPIIPADTSTYEECYGDAYVGAPLKYVYPNGYQSMRPRGGPWKLSIVICILFTWLSVFIVGHCSVEDMMDDDSLTIDTKWCGSHLLYAMWVMSMLITGCATAYCCVIGYIKVRDFAVANSRSQPPQQQNHGKSDYYLSLGDARIYQSDGTPTFWGGHILRPTQAAVAVTSR